MRRPDVPVPTASIMPIHVFYHESFMRHDPGDGHPESPERVRAIVGELHAPAWSQWVTWHEAPPARDADLLRVHPREYLEFLRAVAAQGGAQIEADTAMSAGSYEAAVRAAGASVAAARSALDGAPAFAPVRPPGHHALSDAAMGFCLLGNVVIAARAMLEERGLRRVLIVDWDVHHGNGTQAMVEREPRIRYVSLHQFPFYPGTGAVEERGVGNVFNVPRPPGLPRQRYVTDLEDAVSRATEGWSPELIIISAGFDAMAGDPLAGFTLEPDDYAHWVRTWRGLGAPIASVLEGGYAPQRINLAAGEHIKAMID